MKKNFVSNIRDFLLRHNDFRGVVLFILISAVLWIFLKLNNRYRTDLAIPVHYTDRSGRPLPDSLFTDTLIVRFRGTGWDWLFHRRAFRSLHLPFGKYDEKIWAEKLRARGWPSAADVTEWKKNRRRKKYAFAGSLPLRLNPRFKVPPHYALRSLEPLTDTVLVLARRKPAKAFVSLSTDEISLNPSDTLVSVPLNAGKDMLLFPPDIRFRVKVEAYREGKINLPIRLPAAWKGVILPMPREVEVHYRYWRSVNPRSSAWEIGVDSTLKTDRLFLRVIRHPRGVFDIRLIPTQVDYLEMKPQ